MLILLKHTKMKRVIQLVLLMMIAQITQAQGPALNYISNKYLKSVNEIKSLAVFNGLRNTIYKSKYNEDYPIQRDELISHVSYYKFTYNESLTVQKQGLADIYYSNNAIPISIEENMRTRFLLVQQDVPQEDIVKEVIKNSSIHAAFFYYKNDISTYVIFHSKSKPGFIFATIDINLPTEKRNEFARDFIQSMLFK